MCFKNSLYNAVDICLLHGWTLTWKLGEVG